MTPVTPAPGRKSYIDWARGLAVLLMIEAHTIDAWTRTSDRRTLLFAYLTILGGFAAPLFLWLAGLGVTMSASRVQTRTGSRATALDNACRRGFEIFILAFLFRLQAFVVSPGGHPVTLFRVDVLNIMASLLDKSFVQQVEQVGNEPRFMMLETMREFGLAALAASGEVEATRQVHAEYYLALAEEAEPELFGSRQAMWLNRLEQKHDNFRAALLWFLEQKEIEAALRLGSALRRLWFIRGYLSEGRQWL